MDPITLILAALAAGAAAGLKDTATTAIADAYTGLKSLIRSRFSRTDHREQDIDEQLAAVDRNPEIDPSPLAVKLRTVGAGNDAEMVQAAKALLEKVDPDGKWQRQIQSVIISNSKGVVGNNSGTVTMNFNDGD